MNQGARYVEDAIVEIVDGEFVDTIEPDSTW